MAAALKFDLGGTAFEAVPVKLERKKLYGYTEVVAMDAAGEVCQAARLDPDGSLVVPPGGVKTGILSDAGTWLDRSELKAVDADGNELPIVPSAFGQVIALDHAVDEATFLDHNWKSVYQLDNPDLAKALGDRIYQFVFNYRTDACPEEGFLLAANGLAYLFAGERLVCEFTGLETPVSLEATPEDTPAEDEELDFSMM